MVILKFAVPHWDPQAQTMDYKPLATVWVDGDQVHLEGDGSVFSTEVPVVEPETGDRLIFHEDPERWAKAYPTAFRSGDVQVHAFVHMPVGAHALEVEHA